MTNDEIRIAVAELCGWRQAFPKIVEPIHDTKREGITLPYTWINERTGESRISLPNYPASLDACAEFLRDMPPELRVRYIHCLAIDVLGLCPLAGDFFMAQELDSFAMIVAKPVQHSEAFLRLHNKWKGTE